MNSSLTAVVLCIAMQAAAAAAQCVAPAPSAQQARPSADAIKKMPVAAAPAAQTAHAGGELIKTASAGTHDELPGITRSPAVSVSRGQPDDEHRPSGPAMLLAALALMSGIALRRFGAHKE